MQTTTLTLDNRIDIPAAKSESMAVLLLVFLGLVSTKFFSARIFDTGSLKYAVYGIICLAALLSWKGFVFAKGGYASAIRVLFLSIIVSLFACYIGWRQSLSFSVSAIPFLAWILYFLLDRKQYTAETVENSFIVLGWLYIVLFLFQFFNSSTVFFGYREEFKVDRGVTRINFPGAGVFFFAYFIALCRFSGKEKVAGSLLFIGAGIAVTILQVTRQNILLLLLITAFHFIRNLSPVKLILVGLLMAGVFALVFHFNTELLDGLMGAQNETVAEGTQNVRVMSARFYLTRFSPSLINSLFGNGFPNGNSAYGRYVSSLEENESFYMTDIGLIGMYTLFGIFSVIAMLYLLVKGLFSRIPKRSRYIKYYLALLAVTGLTSDYLFSINFLFATVSAFYLLSRIDDKKEKEMA